MAALLNDGKSGDMNGELELPERFPPEVRNKTDCFF